MFSIATSALAVTGSNHSARSHPQLTQEIIRVSAIVLKPPRILQCSQWQIKESFFKNMVKVSCKIAVSHQPCWSNTDSFVRKRQKLYVFCVLPGRLMHIQKEVGREKMDVESRTRSVETDVQIYKTEYELRRTLEKTISRSVASVSSVSTIVEVIVYRS